jgi:hypothetical protein
LATAAAARRGLQVAFNHRLAAERERRTLENDRTSLANAQKR